MAKSLINSIKTCKKGLEGKTTNFEQQDRSVHRQQEKVIMALVAKLQA